MIRLTLEAPILLAAPVKVGFADGMVTVPEPSEADGADGATVPAEAVPTGTGVVLLEIGYGATGTALLSGTTGTAGAVLRMTAGAVLRMMAGAVLRMTAGFEEFETTIGATGVNEGTTMTGVEERATG